MYLWAVQWPTQKIRKEVHGQAKEVEVLGGQAEFCTLAAAEEHARKLGACWPGLKLRIVPAVVPSTSPIPGKAAVGPGKEKRPTRGFRKAPAELALAD